MGASAVTLPPGFELQPQAPGMGTGVLPGEGAGPGREVAGSRVDPRQAVRQPPDVPQASPGRPQQGPAPVAQAAAPAPAQAGGGVPALPPGFELQQPAAAPAPPPRQVGVLETMGRTALAAAIPVVRSIDMAAAGLAGMLAPALGLNPEEEQAKLFKDSEARVARMQQMYAPQAGEQMSRAGQLAGGLLSTPIEMVGGMGVQRGLERSADVVQRGGTVGEAALAGGVTGAANVAANLLPVKAGGVVGRTVENTLGRGLGSRAAQVAGGALTGGTIAAAGDVGVTEASNLALPEGEQFQDLQQEADPLTSFGLGAAFGGAAARAERSAGRRAAQAAGQPQDVPATGLRGQPAGAEAPAGSVGAAGADEALVRRERAAALPVPIDLTEGQATRRFEHQQFERETAKNAETGAPLREHFDEQNERLARNFDQFVDMTGAEQTSTRGVGQVVDKALREKMDERKAEITKAYDAAREAGDMAEPVPTDALVAYLNKTGPESINAKVLQAVREKLVQLGGAKRDGEGGLTAAEIPINDLEEIRKMINRVSETAPDQHFGSIIKEQIDAITADAGGDLYREARRLRTNYAREFNDRAVVNDLVRNKRGTADRAVALEDVFERSILRRSLDDVRHLRRVLQTAGESGAQAWRELQGQTLRHLQDQALRNASRDQRGNPVVSFAGLNKAVNELDADGRLEFIFGKKGAEQLRDLRDIAADVVTSPPGSVNTSNTGSMLINALDTMVTFGASGVPVPAFAILRKGMQAIRERGVRKRVTQALQQPEGLRQGAPAEAGRFGEEAPTEPAEGGATETPAPAGAEGATDPRLAEIERLRAATNNPDVHDVLDRRQRKVEAELEATRAQAERAQQAEEIDALARSSTDPEIRRALAARAEKLRGGAIPVGEATELSEVPGPKLTEPRRPLPVGEATELPVQRVEPAGQDRPLPVGEATELPRSAAGSDPDADLTLMQAGAPAKGPASRTQAAKRAGAPRAEHKVNGSSILSVISRAGGIDPYHLGDLSQRRELVRVNKKTGKRTHYVAWHNPLDNRPGGGPVFRRGGTRDFEVFANLLAEEGVIPRAMLESDPQAAAARAYDIIKAELRDPGSTLHEGDDASIEAEMQRRRDLAMGDPAFHEQFSTDDLDEAGYAAAAPEVRAEVERLVQLADQQDIDIEALRESAAIQTEGQSDDAYQARLEQLIEAALERGQEARPSGGREAAGDQGDPRAQQRQDRPDEAGEGETLTRGPKGPAKFKRAGESLEDVRKAIEADGVDAFISERDGTIELSRIVVPKDKRGQGIGTAAMQRLIDYADASGQRIVLTPSADFGGNKTRLVEFYQRHGFKPNAGRSRDFTTRATMIREPKRPAQLSRAGASVRRGTAEQAIAQGYTVKAYRGVSKAKPFNDTGTTWLTTDRAVAEAYAEEVMGYDDPAVLEVMVNPSDLQQHDIRRLTGDELQALEPDEFGNPQKLGIYRNSDDHPLGGKRGVTVIHAPREAVFEITKEGDERPDQLSRAPGLPAKPFKARAELESALRAKLGHKLVDGLMRRNVITLGGAPADVPRDAQGRFTGNIVELFHDRLDADTAPEVLMHEVGEHYGMQKMLGDRRYAELLEDVRQMRQRPEVAKAWATVKRNYPDVPESSPVFVSEVAAHLVETAPDRPIVRRMLDAPRAYLYSQFGVNLGRTDPALLRALAVGALRRAAGVEAITPNVASLATAGTRQQEKARAE